MRNKLLACALFLSVICMHAKTVFVNSPSQLQSAVNSASPGDIIILRNGTYNNFILNITKSGNAGNYITIEAENGGQAKFRGTVGIKINANYIKISGFDFEGATIPSSENLIEVSGNNNIIEDMFIKGVSNGSHSKHRYVMLESSARNNLVNRCWFEKGTQKGIVVFGDYKGNVPAYSNTIQNCYFKAQRQPSNGGSAMRFGTGGQKPRINGNTTVKNNLFDRYDGENEIISIKSSNNTIEGNTFTNCYGQLTCRHYHNNTIKNNFFLTTQSRPDGDVLAVWGEGHKILNNYFSNSKSRFSTGGAISLVAGNTETEATKQHEAVANVLIKDNIIYNANDGNHAISFGDTYKKGGDQKRIIMPRDITIQGNYIFKSSNKAQIVYVKPPKNIMYSNNKIFKNVGLSPIPSGISNTNPNLKADRFGIFRADGKGPSGNPLTKSDVGPNWLNGNNGGGTTVNVTSVTVSPTSVSLNVGTTRNLNVTVLPNNATNKSVTWDSNNTSVATVNTNGTVTAVASGTARITVTTNNGNKTATSTITVTGGGNNGGTTTTSLSPIHDAYLQGTTGLNNTLIRIESGKRIGYLQYDLSGISGNITSAKLKLKCTGDKGNGTIEIGLGNTSNWTENNLSNNNKPTSTSVIGSLNSSYSIGTTYTWNLDTSTLTSGGKLSLIITQTGGNDVAFASKENSATAPQLEITYTSGTTRTLTSKETISKKALIEEKAIAYPNPFKSNITVVLEDYHNFDKLELYNISGKSYLSKAIDNNDKELLLENLNLSKGIYIIKLTGKNISPKMLKLIKN